MRKICRALRRGEGRPRAGVGAGILLAALLAAPAAGAPPASASPISTQGVVVFGITNDGTYRMGPAGTTTAKIAPDWYACDVSRGRTPVTVVMNVGGDLYAQRADATGSRVALVVSARNDVQGRFSLDGEQFAFVSVDRLPP